MDAVAMAGMFLLGWMSGYLIRVLKRLLLLVMGGQALFLLYLQRSGVITINYSALYEKFKWLVTDKAVELMIQYAEVGLPYACGFLLGVFVPRSILRPSPPRKYVAFRR